jgi:GTP-binding protein
LRQKLVTHFDETCHCPSCAPDVGKSTPYQPVDQTQVTIVADILGLTLIVITVTETGPHEYIVIDTGGFRRMPSPESTKECDKHARPFISIVILWLMPVPVGISAQDTVASYLRSSENRRYWPPTRPRTAEGTQVSGFFELGLGEMLAVSIIARARHANAG